MSQSTIKCQNSDGAVTNGDFHFKRKRLNQTFMEAMNYPVIIVCAGAGYGKTTAVHDFVQEYKASTVWVQLSDRDNVGGRFWENFSHSMTLIDNAQFAASIKKLGFPDTQEKLQQFNNLVRDHEDKKRRIVVFDDCHFIENTAVIRFVEEAICNLPIGTTLLMISRSTPRINIAAHVSSNRIYNVSEDELRFTENELAQYFRRQDISLHPDSLRKIMQDTEGWAFALNYIVRSYKKAPGYDGYLRNAMKANIFRFMEMEIWDTISERLQNFMVRLSLIDHLSIDLIVLLAGTEKELITDMERQNAYVRRDSYINALLIHPLFLEFLTTKQDLLSPEQKHETYTIAGEWCFKNGFKIDALSYYEKIGSYMSIVAMFIGSPSQIPYDISSYAAEIFERTPAEVFDKVQYLASIHLRTIMCQGLWQEAIKKAEYYEAKFLQLSENDPFKKSSLSSIYYCWGITRGTMCLSTHIYDFDIFFEKQSKCYSTPIDPGKVVLVSPGPWACIVGDSKKGTIHEYLEALKRSVEHFSRCYINSEDGRYDLAYGEFKFYQGDINTAESHITHSLNRAREKKMPEIMHRALFYTLRISVLQGNYTKTQQALKEMKTLLDDPGYFNRFTDHDITLCWYYFVLNQPEKIPDWFKENFSLYADACFVENYANQMKARYCFMTRNYHSVLSYIQDMKQRESFLFGRIEMLAIEACIHYKMKNKEKAYNTFVEAYNESCPNNITMPFIELGKDMRTLSVFALNNNNEDIPKSWLEEINRKSASYAKRLAHIATEYKKASGIANNIAISPRESEILMDLSQGLSRTEISISRNLSINTVKMLVNNVYMKLGAENLAEAIRIATERKLL
jgi:LuxR family maltose regulon positive regulatory protein